MTVHNRLVVIFVWEARKQRMWGYLTCARVSSTRRYRIDSKYMTRWSGGLLQTLVGQAQTVGRQRQKSGDGGMDDAHAAHAAALLLEHEEHVLMHLHRIRRVEARSRADAVCLSSQALAVSCPTTSRFTLALLCKLLDFLLSFSGASSHWVMQGSYEHDTPNAPESLTELKCSQYEP